ncbi:hypothetical protein FACS189425_05700 [Clostridia bacterium]|nr:hypothetical protein FACS189425_05700 [Clostridia bacterium]
MSLETSAILRTLLLQMNKAKSVDEAVGIVRVMCSKDDIDAVEHELRLEQERVRGGM